MISRLDHVSIAVKDYSRASEFFTKILGCVPGASDTEKDLGFFWEILSAGDLSRLELLTPAGDDSFLTPFLSDKKAGGVHHITFETSDLYAVKENLEKHNVPYFGFSTDKPGWQELFIHPRDAFGVLVQIAQFSPDEWLDSSLIFKKGARWSTEKTDDGGRLSIQHPGGGKADITLSRLEVERLIKDLNALL